MSFKSNDEEISPRGVTHQMYCALIVSIALSIALTVIALVGKEITLEYRNFRVEINHSQVCKLP